MWKPCSPGVRPDSYQWIVVPPIAPIAPIATVAADGRVAPAVAGVAEDAPSAARKRVRAVPPARAGATAAGANECESECEAPRCFVELDALATDLGDLDEALGEELAELAQDLREEMSDLDFELAELSTELADLNWADAMEGAGDDLHIDLAAAQAEIRRARDEARREVRAELVDAQKELTAELRDRQRSTAVGGLDAGQRAAIEREVQAAMDQAQKEVNRALGLQEGS
ncbi:MAG: hypothetical protein FJ293_07170 [Planctomycetes bacterium]|nr:hypothetical protein [Planctomycetota bacterium]